MNKLSGANCSTPSNQAPASSSADSAKHDRSVNTTMQALRTLTAKLSAFNGMCDCMCQSAHPLPMGTLVDGEVGVNAMRCCATMRGNL